MNNHKSLCVDVCICVHEEKKGLGVLDKWLYVIMESLLYPRELWHERYCNTAMISNLLEHVE